MLAIDVIRDVSSSGDFLSHRHTLEHMMSTQWRPKLINRMGYDKWHASGGPSLMERTQKKLQQIMQEHKPVPIAADQAEAIKKRVEQFC